jgi:hypothetical protein
MKTFSLGLVLALLLAQCGCGTCHRADKFAEAGGWSVLSNETAGQWVRLLTITANVDGSGKFVFTPQDAHYEHLNWSPPTNVAINGEPWGELGHTPDAWRRFSDGLDLTHARIVERQGCDVIALEPTAKGFDLYMDDSPNGSADYSVVIAIPRRE